jgi:hypothetical protein
MQYFNTQWGAMGRNGVQWGAVGRNGVQWGAMGHKHAWHLFSVSAGTRTMQKWLWKKEFGRWHFQIGKQCGWVAFIHKHT